MQTFDITPVFRASAALDHAWDSFNNPLGFDQRGHPEYDLLKTGDDDFRITLAVPGYRQSELNIEMVTEGRDRILHVSGKKDIDPNHNQYLYQGLRDRQFTRRFTLPEHVHVTGASLDAGMLNIDLVREIPEELQPRRIEINVDSPPNQFIGAAEAA